MLTHFYCCGFYRRNWVDGYADGMVAAVFSLWCSMHEKLGESRGVPPAEVFAFRRSGLYFVGFSSKLRLLPYAIRVYDMDIGGCEV